MKNVTMYGTASCPYCNMAEQLLQSKGIQAQKILVDQAPGAMQAMIERTGKRTVPQIFIEDAYVGGFDALSSLNKGGMLDGLLK